jgi:hypothetical protein
MAVIVLLFLLFLCFFRGTIGRKLLGLLAVLADALVHDVCDLDGHRLGVLIPVGREARRVPDGAIHVLHAAAADADGVVVVVAHTGFIQCGGVRGFETPEHVQVREVPEHHVYRLRGQLGELRPGSGKDAFGRGVGVAFDGGQDGKPLLGHPAAVGAQGSSPVLVAVVVFRHGSIEALIMNISQ